MENLSYLRLDNSTPMPELLSAVELDKKYNFGIILNFSEDQIKKISNIWSKLYKSYGTKSKCF